MQTDVCGNMTWSTANAAPEKKTEASARLAIMLGDRERPPSLSPGQARRDWAQIGHRTRAGAGRYQ